MAMPGGNRGDRGKTELGKEVDVDEGINSPAIPHLPVFEDFKQTTMATSSPRGLQRNGNATLFTPGPLPSHRYLAIANPHMLSPTFNSGLQRCVTSFFLEEARPECLNHFSKARTSSQSKLCTLVQGASKFDHERPTLGPYAEFFQDATYEQHCDVSHLPALNASN
jgi:hypothetical protein